MTAIGIVLIVVALILYVGNVLLIKWFIERRAPGLLDIDLALPKPRDGEPYLWERTAGTGIVPRWVSVLGLASIPLGLAGLIVLVIAWLS